MRYVIMGVIAVICFVLQSSLLNYIEIYDVRPNLIIITIISYALIRGRVEGAIYGLCAGLLYDIMGGKVIGLSGLLGMYTGLVIGSLNKRIYNENYFLSTMITAGGTLFYTFLYYVFNYLFMGYEQFIWHLIGYVLPEALYNAVLSVFVYFFILYINKKIDYYKKMTRPY